MAQIAAAFAQGIGKTLDEQIKHRLSAPRPGEGKDEPVNMPGKPKPLKPIMKDVEKLPTITRPLPNLGSSAVGPSPDVSNLPAVSRPLSLKKGTDYVPKTGIYKLHEGEAVVPKEKNVAIKTGGEHTPEERAHFHRAMSHLHAGALHRHLGIPEGEKIPLEKKQDAANSDNPHIAAQGRLALAMHGWKHPGKK